LLSYFFLLELSEDGRGGRGGRKGGRAGTTGNLSGVVNESWFPHPLNLINLKKN
jgi:hypothetical protein